MKSFRSLITAVAVVCLLALTLRHGWMVGLAGVFLLGASQLKPMAQLNDATLIVPILTGNIMKAFRTRVPELSFFSTDFGMSGGVFAQPVKWLQDVISQITTRPTVSDHTPGDDITTSAQDATDLLVDVKARINRAKIVKIKLPQASAVALAGDKAFLAILEEAGIELGRAVVQDVMLEADAGNFSHSITEDAATADYTALSKARKQLNAQGAKGPRFIIGSPDFVGNISDDPDVRSGDFHGQLVEGDPYVSLRNIQGFSEVREFPDMPSGSATVGTFTAVAATDVITLTGHELKNGDRVRVSSSTTLPAGLSAATNYFVRDATADTFKLAATAEGTAINITDTGTGTHTLATYQELNAFAFEKRAIHIAFRQLLDNTELARQLGVPVTFLTRTEVDPETGLTMTVHLYLDPKTQDLYAAVIVAYGVVAGRGAAGPDTVAAAQAADSGLDPAGLRIVEAAGAA